MPGKRPTLKKQIQGKNNTKGEENPAKLDTLSMSLHPQAKKEGQPNLPVRQTPSDAPSLNAGGKKKKRDRPKKCGRPRTWTGKKQQTASG